MFSEQPLAIFEWSIFEHDFRMAVGPFFSTPLLGDRLFEVGSPAFLPLGVGPSRFPSRTCSPYEKNEAL